MDLRKLKKLIDLVEESGIAELEITEGEEKVRISKSSNPAQGSATPVVTMAQPHLPASVIQAGAGSSPPSPATSRLTRLGTEPSKRASLAKYRPRNWKRWPS